MPDPAPMAPDVRDAPSVRDAAGAREPRGAPGGEDPDRRTRLRRELLFLGVVGGFGLVVLPPLVYFAGAATLGPYEGGLGTFLGKLYGDLVRLTPAALGLVFGPYVMFQGARFLTRPLRNRQDSGKART